MTTTLNPPRSDLYRMHTPVKDLVLRSNGEAVSSLEGYAAVFNSLTTINSWEGTFTEEIAPGAFKKTLQQSDAVRLLYDHGFDPSIGYKPLGAISVLREDEHGLWVEADLVDRPYVHDIAAAIEARALDGMSFKFSVVREDWEDSETLGKFGHRIVKEAKLHEVSVVTFPAYSATKVGVRGTPAYTLLRDILAADSGTSCDTPPEPGHLSDERQALLERVRQFHDKETAE